MGTQAVELWLVPMGHFYDSGLVNKYLKSPDSEEPKHKFLKAIELG